ncbi:MAG: tetratricopeptide repeat protein [Chloroflexota bacterium]
MISPNFRREVVQAEINVPKAALYFAQSIAYPDLYVADYLALVEGLATAVSDQLVSSAFIHTNAITLSNFLFEECGYRGNAAAYGDPRNSYFNEVIDRRLGIPISLSVLYVAVAKLLDIPAYGVGLPGHFIIAVGPNDNKLLLDPFHNGRQLTFEDCAKLVRLTTGYNGPFLPEWLQPTPPRDILVRMLNNLRIAYIKQSVWKKATAVINHLILLQPETHEHVRDLGLIYFENGRYHQAANYLDTYLQKAPDASDADAIKQHVSKALSQWARLN